MTGMTSGDPPFHHISTLKFLLFFETSTLHCRVVPCRLSVGFHTNLNIANPLPTALVFCSFRRLLIRFRKTSQKMFNGGFLKWEYPQIIRISMGFSTLKQPFLVATPHFPSWTPPLNPMGMFQEAVATEVGKIPGTASSSKPLPPRRGSD